MTRKFIMIFMVAVALTIANSSFAKILKLSSTTSTQNTGLLGFLSKQFKTDTGYTLAVIAVGTGRALKLAQNCDVDVTLVHAPSLERKFVANGYGIDRRIVMANYFVIVGPKSDPADVKNASSAKNAFIRIARSKSDFLSRDDNSGTNVKEKTIWKMADIAPSGSWYERIGHGMGATLMMASEKNAYTLSDIGTYLKMKDKLDIVPLYDKKSRLLYNPYHVMAVNPNHCSNVDYKGALKFDRWITSKRVQKLIASYKDSEGKTLFTPLAIY